MHAHSFLRLTYLIQEALGTFALQPKGRWHEDKFGGTGTLNALPPACFSRSCGP